MSDLPDYTEAPERPTDSNIRQHAWDELNRAGLFTEDGDFYGGMTGRAVMTLVDSFVLQGHSGMSAAMTLDIFSKVIQFKPLGPLTDDPEEWVQHSEEVSGNPGGLWQSKRQSDAFSEDGGKTYYIVSNREEIFSTEKKEQADG